MKDKIRQFATELGVDDIGFAAVADYYSPRSPKIETIFPQARSIIVLAYKELVSVESDNPQIAVNGRLDVMEFSRSVNYKLARYLDKEFKARVMTVPVSYPLDMSGTKMGAIGDVSLRHAAVAAGLGVMGRHNLVIHPRFGTRVIFTALLCDQDLPSDPPVTAELCDNCNLCVMECPAGALDDEGKTNVIKCLNCSQPYGLGANVKFWQKFIQSSPEEQKKMFRDPHYLQLYQAQTIGFQYTCFNCEKVCPVGL